MWNIRNDSEFGPKINVVGDQCGTG